MKQNKRGRPKQQQQKQKHVALELSPQTYGESKQPDYRSTTPQYDKIMAQIKETYATLNDVQQHKRKNSENIKQTKKQLKQNKSSKKRGRPSKKSSKPSSKIADMVKLEPQETIDIQEKFKVEFQSVVKKFLENIKSEFHKAEQELLKIQYK